MLSMSRLFVFILVLTFFQYSYSIRCKSCYSYNNQACVSAPDCESGICLYEQLNAANGVFHVLKTCYTKGNTYRFDDGTIMSNMNQCVTRTTLQGQYYVSLCNSEDYCNLDCRTGMVPTLPPTPGPIVPLGTVICYDCSTTDGTDCQTKTCQGAYCLYSRRITNSGQMEMKKSCLIDPAIILDDDTVVRSVDICEVRNTATSQNYVKICNDLDYCNNYCNPGQSPTLPPQRQNLVTCYNCEGSNDCFTGSCQGNYCIYEKQYRPSNGTTYYRKSCSEYSYALYPDNSRTIAVQQCETRLIADVYYNVKLCSTGSYCNINCQNTPTITCQQCYAQNQDDCSGGTCQGNYCVFVREKSQIDSTKWLVKKSCSATPVADFPDNTGYTDFGNCQIKNLASAQYTIKICNSTLCNTACAVPAGSSGFNHSSALSLIISVSFFLIFI